ncbi:MAG: LysR family transcriptional regulator [Sphingomonas fennica]
MSGSVTSPWEINLRHLNAVRAIAATGSLGRAAGAVFLSQPAVTQALAKLERLLGTRLCERGGAGGVTMTAAGALLVARADRAAAHLAEGARRLKGAGARGALPIERLVSMVHLRALIAVVGHGTFAVAARETGLSQPSLHRAARDLERLAGAALLVRRGRTVQPTPGAERFVRHARLAVAEIAAGLDELAALKGQGGGRIAIGAMPLARARLVPEAVTRLAAERPDMRFEIVEGPYANLLGRLRDGALDLLIGALREPAPAPDVTERALFTDTAIIVARAGHPLAGAARPTLADLAHYPWVMARAGTPLRHNWEALFTACGATPPPVVVECGSVVAISGMLLAGDWLTLLSPEQVRRSLNAGSLVPIGPPVSAARRAIGITVRTDWLPSAAQARFLAILAGVACETSGK